MKATARDDAALLRARIEIEAGQSARAIREQDSERGSPSINVTARRWLPS